MVVFGPCDSLVSELSLLWASAQTNSVSDEQLHHILFKLTGPGIISMLVADGFHPSFNYGDPISGLRCG